ncbi:hypothetical protein IWW56_001754 [Coemansia sp. RSA 2131]|nr:hypothetical protein IWW56_001754 [Coemansia sp. RSA 2131]
MILAPIAQRSVAFRGVFGTSRLLQMRRPSMIVAQRTYIKRPQWSPLVKTFVYTAGGVAVVTMAWPVLRFVVLGGLGYAAYKAFRLYLTFRQINNAFGSTTLWEQIQKSMGFSAAQPAIMGMVRTRAIESLRAAYLNDTRVQDALGGHGLIEESDIDLGEAMEVETESGAEERVEALFPVVVGGHASACVVESVWTAGAGTEDYHEKEVSMWVRQPTGSVVGIKIDPIVTEPGPRKKSNVQDADYRDL